MLKTKAEMNNVFEKTSNIDIFKKGNKWYITAAYHKNKNPEVRTLSLLEWSKVTKIAPRKLRMRIKLGYDGDRVINEKVNKRKKAKLWTTEYDREFNRNYMKLYRKRYNKGKKRGRKKYTIQNPRKNTDI